MRQTDIQQELNRLIGVMLHAQQDEPVDRLAFISQTTAATTDFMAHPSMLERGESGLTPGSIRRSQGI